MYKDETTAALRRIPFALYDLTGALQTGATITGSEVQLSKNGASYSNGAGSVTEVGAGSYYYEATSGETDTEGFVLLKIANTGSAVAIIEVRIEKRVEDRMAAWVHDSGRTFIGLMGRLEAFISGKATGLSGTIARFYRSDGTTVSFFANQDVGAGTRDGADVSDRP